MFIKIILETGDMFIVSFLNVNIMYIIMDDDGWSSDMVGSKLDMFLVRRG